jgi:hypothetical protein
MRGAMVCRYAKPHFFGVIRHCMAFISAFLLRRRPLGLLFGISFAFALGVCLSMFDVGFLTGTAPYWQAPRGLVGGSWADISSALSGYYYFVQDHWTWPLLQTSTLGAPHPVNIIFTDSIPVLALLGRLLYRATGVIFNPYGAWTALCFFASALSMTGLVAIIGQRSLAAALTATGFGLCMSPLLARFGHLALMGQWEIPLALMLYFTSTRRPWTKRLVASAVLLAAVTLWTQLYLFVMVMGILAAALAQAIIDRRLGLWRAAWVSVLGLSVLLSLAFVSGYDTSQGSLSTWGFGTFSMNLVSPVVSPFSTLYSLSNEDMVDATGGQYEGYSYLGAGALFLTIMTLPWLGRSIRRAWHHHFFLIMLMLLFTAFAVSNQITFAMWHVVTIPLPLPVLQMAGMFRSSGRFSWPCLYLLSAVVILAAPSLWGRSGGILLMMALVLQLADTGSLRSALAARITMAAPTPLAQARWENAIRQHDFLRVVPPFGCLSGRSELAVQTALELQLLASRQNIPTNTVYAARHDDDCTPPQVSVLAPNELRVYLLSDSQTTLASNATGVCVTNSTLAVCSQRLGASDLAALVNDEPPAVMAVSPRR